MNKFKGIAERIETEMLAATFAEAGEFGTAREIVRGREKVLLGLTGGEGDQKAVRYAVSFCRRVGAALEILHLNSARETVRQVTDELKSKGVGYRVHETEGCIRREIIDLTQKERDIRVVVIDGDDLSDGRCSNNDRIFARRWDGLACPLVVVSG